jgi:TetR/AcrR family transcriptional repressor of nem operon
MARPKSFDEDAVLDQAAELFWERGYEGTSLADLETHLGLGRQSLYNTFGDKHGLFLKALDRYREHAGEKALGQLGGPEGGLKALRRYFEWAVEMLTSSDVRRGCLVTNTISELGSADSAALLRCNHSRDQLERAFRGSLAHAKAKGELPKSLDVEATATLLAIHNYGLHVMAKTGATRKQLLAAVEALFAGLN